MVNVPTWEAFLERLLERLHHLHAHNTKADILILLGRRDKLTGAPLPPRVEVREHEL